MAENVGNGAFEGKSAEEFVGLQTEDRRSTRGDGGVQDGLCFLRPSSGTGLSEGAICKTVAYDQRDGPQSAEA
jgi:hypothetical protein